MIIEPVAVAVQAGIPTLLIGPPGTAKTALSQALADSMGAHLETVIASIRGPQEFAGLPITRRVQWMPIARAFAEATPPAPFGWLKAVAKRAVDIGEDAGGDGDISLAPPAWARRAKKAENSLVFFDELSTAAPAVQAACLRVLQERWVGDLYLGDHVNFLAAMNPVDQAAGGWELAYPMANRVFHYSWPVNPQLWADGMLNGFPKPSIPTLPKNWREFIPEVNGLVSAFIRSRQELLYIAPKSEEQAGKANPTPRSWTNAAVALAAAKSIQGKLSDFEGTETTLVAGLVGAGNAAEFFSWREKLDLPDPEVLLRNPGSFKLLNRDDKNYAVLSGIVTLVMRTPSQARLNAAWKILVTAAQSKPDIGAASARILAGWHGDRMAQFEIPYEDLVGFMPILQAAGLWQRS